MSHVNFNFESDFLEDKYRTILLETYTLEIIDLIFSNPNEGFLNEHFTEGLIHGQCIGCQYNCGSQKHHDICLLPFEQQIERLFDFAVALIEERKITHVFQQKIIANFPLAELTRWSSHAYFLSEEWRKESFLTNYIVYSELMDRAIVHRHLYLNETSPFEGKRKGWISFNSTEKTPLLSFCFWELLLKTDKFENNVGEFSTPTSKDEKLEKRFFLHFPVFDFWLVFKNLFIVSFRKLPLLIHWCFESLSILRRKIHI